MFADVAAGYTTKKRADNSFQNANGRTIKSSDKPASGISISSAGGNASGVVVSDPGMKTEYALLRIAQEKAKDGISLVQTADGALQEINDMLEYLAELLDQSANGNDSLDRSILQSEVEQVKKEIDRIADTANFNGQKLIDGSLNGYILAGMFQDMDKTIAKSINDKIRVAAANEFGISAYSCDEPVIASRAARGADAAGGTTGPPVMNTDDNIVFQKKEEVSGQSGAPKPAKVVGEIGDPSNFRDGHYVEINGVKFEFDTNNEQYFADSVRIDIAGKTKSEIITALEDAIKSNADIRTSMGLEDGTDIGCTITGDGKITLTQTFDVGSTVTEEIQAALNGKEFVVSTGSAVPVNGSKITGEVNEWGDLTLNIQKDSIKDGMKFGLKLGNQKVGFEVRVVDDEAKITNVVDVSAGILYVSEDNWHKGFVNMNGTFLSAFSKMLESYGDYDIYASFDPNGNKLEILATKALNSSAPTPEFDETVVQEVQPPLEFQVSAGESNVKSQIEAPRNARSVYTIDTKELKDGDIFTLAGATFELDSDGSATGSGNTVIMLDANVASNFMNAMQALGTSNQDYTFVTSESNGVVTLEITSKAPQAGEKIVISSNITRQPEPPKPPDPPTPPTPPSPPDYDKPDPQPPDIPDKPVDPDKPDDPDDPDTHSKPGKPLRLQIGEGVGEVVYVSIEDMSAKGLHIDGINIGTQEGAAKAVEAIMSAINKVSRNRGTLGALTNRLEHACNSLGISYINITDAETKISGADVAQEMMQYIKYQIVMQTAQGMLAQANNMNRQSVQQLLSV